ncbi:MAG: 2-hydroxyacyl-CoA dehydratase family protein [Eubacterium sp.]|nr:2-hydroxyacyl-CoA dehydratase family protein [Eubacterium sp.]
MADLIAKFGNFVGNRIENHPTAVKNMLLAAYHGKRIQLAKFPLKGLSPARNEMALISMDAVIDPMAHPENAALVSIFTPCELLQTYGIHPMLAEAMACYITGAAADRGFVEYAEEAGIPQTFCSYHKILLGSILSGVLPKPQFVFNTSLACDANNLTFRKAAEYWQIPHYYVDVPMEVSEDSVAYVADQLRDFADFLEETRGPLNMEDLKARIASGNRTMANFAACQKAKRGRYLSNDLTDELYEVFGNHVLLGQPDVEAFSGHLLRDLKNCEKSSGVRLLWMHTIPYYQKNLRDTFNFSRRCQVVACDMNYDAYIERDPEKPFEAMAARLVYDAFNGTADRRIARSLEIAREVEADGIVYFCHWGCKHTLGAAQNARITLENAGYPTLILDGDGCDSGNASNGQVATRMQAFIEMLENRKAAQNAAGENK